VGFLQPFLVSHRPTWFGLLGTSKETDVGEVIGVKAGKVAEHGTWLECPPDYRPQIRVLLPVWHPQSGAVPGSARCLLPAVLYAEICEGR